MEDKEKDVIEAIINQLSIVADYNPQGVLDVLENALFINMIFEKYQDYFKEHLQGLQDFITNELKAKEL
tara:strand:+ start:316 stop:522 length:207 start_codon:yes stop_codon:yes gene_type:complete